MHTRLFYLYKYAIHTSGKFAFPYAKFHKAKRFPRILQAICKRTTKKFIQKNLIITFPSAFQCLSIKIVLEVTVTPNKNKFSKNSVILL